MAIESTNVLPPSPRASAANRLGIMVARFGRLSTLQRVVLGSAVIAIVVGTTWWFHASREPDFSVLVRSVDLADANDITHLLKEQKISYRLEDDGATILVARDALYEARIAVAGKGLPHNGSTGFELFDKGSVNLSEFNEKVSWLRAMQGELARTIQEVDGVEHARVHLSIPQEEVFADNKKVATASVTLRVKRGAELTPENVNAIVLLVAHSIQGLDAQHVSVVNQHGRVLWSGTEGTRKHGGADDDATTRFAHGLEERLTTMLTPVVGEGRCQVRVSAKLDFSEKDVQTNRVLHDDAQAKSSQITEEKYRGGSTPSPAPSPVPPQSDYGKRSENIEYQVGTQTAHEITPGGRLEQLHVAVLIDERAVPSLSLVRIETLVREAAGVDRARGDSLSVQTLPFRVSADETPAPPQAVTRQVHEVQTLLAVTVVAIFVVMVLTLVAQGRRLALRPSSPRRLGDPARTAALLQTWMSPEDHHVKR